MGKKKFAYPFALFHEAWIRPKSVLTKESKMSPKWGLWSIFESFIFWKTTAKNRFKIIFLSRSKKGLNLWTHGTHFWKKNEILTFCEKLTFFWNSRPWKNLTSENPQIHWICEYFSTSIFENAIAETAGVCLFPKMEP